MIKVWKGDDLYFGFLVIEGWKYLLLCKYVGVCLFLNCVISWFCFCNKFVCVYYEWVWDCKIFWIVNRKFLEGVVVLKLLNCDKG